MYQANTAWSPTPAAAAPIPLVATVARSAETLPRPTWALTRTSNWLEACYLPKFGGTPPSPSHQSPQAMRC